MSRILISFLVFLFAFSLSAKSKDKPDLDQFLQATLLAAEKEQYVVNYLNYYDMGRLELGQECRLVEMNRLGKLGLSISVSHEGTEILRPLAVVRKDMNFDMPEATMTYREGDYPSFIVASSWAMTEGNYSYDFILETDSSKQKPVTFRVDRYKYVKVNKGNLENPKVVLERVYQSSIGCALKP